MVRSCTRTAAGFLRTNHFSCEVWTVGTLWLGQRWLWLGQIADKATQINCDGSSRPASPITTICFPPTSFSPCITQCVLSFSYLFYPVAHNISLSPLPTTPVARTAPFCFLRFSIGRPFSILSCITTVFSILLYPWLSSALTRFVLSRPASLMFFVPFAPG
jgi:hypothetical protein